MLKESGIETERRIPLIKLVVCYGGFVENVFQRVSDYNHGMYNMRGHVPGVIRLLRMIACFCGLYGGV